MKTYSAKEITEREFVTLGFSNEWLDLVGNPAPDADYVVFGKPKSGKTTFCLKFAQYLAAFGKVLYVSAEMGISVALQEAILRCEATSGNIRYVAAPLLADLSGVIQKGRYKFIVIDSVQSLGLTPALAKELKMAHKHRGFVFILQSKRNGDFKGDQSWVHDTDVKVSLTNGIANATGRYNSEGSMVVINKTKDKQANLF